MPLPLSIDQQADCPAPCEVTVDHGRLQYVTRLLGSQQGLNTALFGAYLFRWNVGEILHWPSGWGKFLGWLAAVAAMRIFFLANQRWIPEYYEKRFGSVKRGPWSKWDAPFFSGFVVLLVIGWPIAHILDPVASGFAGRVHVMMSDPGRQINLWPTVFWMAMLCSSLRWHKTSIERQGLYFDLVGLASFSSIAFYAIWHPDAKQLFLWKVLNAGGIGLSFIAMGLYDHIRLILLLPKRVAEDDDE